MMESGNKKNMKRRRFSRRTLKKMRRHMAALGAAAALCFLMLLVAVNTFGLMQVTAGLFVRQARAEDFSASVLGMAVPAVSTIRGFKVQASAYSSQECQTDSTPCVTADGTDVCRRYFESQKVDTVAINGLPFGTKLRIPKIFPNLVFTVRDRMNPRYGLGHLDIWMPMRDDAINFGRRVVDVEIVE